MLALIAAAAAGIAAMNSIAITSGFFGPYLMGVLKDATGDYLLGLRGLMLAALLAAALMAGLMHTLKRGNRS